MIDLRLTQLSDVVDVYRVSMSSDPEPSVRLEGRNMESVSTVYVNGKRVRFQVLSDTVLDIPEAGQTEGEAITSINALSDSFSGTDRSRVAFDMGQATKEVTGLQKLVQQYALLLLMTPGTDIFHKDRGGGLLQMLGSNLDPSSPSSYTGIVVSAVNKTTKDVIQSQITRRVPDEERLSACAVTNVTYNVASGTLLVALQFDTISGRRYSAAVAIG